MDVVPIQPSAPILAGNVAAAFVPGTSTVLRTVANEVVLWALDTGEVVHLPRSRRDDPECVAASSDGVFGAIGFRNGDVRVIHLGKRKTQKAIRAHRDVKVARVDDLCFLTDGTLLTICGTARGWDPASGTALFEAEAHPPDHSSRCAPLPDGGFLTAGEGGAIAFAPESRAPRTVIAAETIHQVAVTADGTRAATLEYDDLCTYDLVTGKKLGSVALSGSSPRIVTPSRTRVVTVVWKGDGVDVTTVATLWDLETAAKLAEATAEGMADRHLAATTDRILLHRGALLSI